MVAVGISKDNLKAVGFLKLSWLSEKVSGCLNKEVDVKYGC